MWKRHTVSDFLVRRYLRLGCDTDIDLTTDADGEDAYQMTLKFEKE